MANYVLSTAFSDQILLTYLRALAESLRERAQDSLERLAVRIARAKRERALRRALSRLDERALRDIGLA